MEGREEDKTFPRRATYEAMNRKQSMARKEENHFRKSRKDITLLRYNKSGVISRLSKDSL